PGQSPASWLGGQARHHAGNRGQSREAHGVLAQEDRFFDPRKGAVPFPQGDSPLSRIVRVGWIPILPPHLVMITEQASDKSGIDMTILLLETQGRPSPAAQSGGLLCIVLAERTDKIEFAAIGGPPPFSDGISRQAGGDAVPILAHHAGIAHG